MKQFALSCRVSGRSRVLFGAPRLFGAVVLCLIVPVAVWAQQTTPKNEPAPKTVEKKSEIGDAASLSFDQSKVTAQMAELEERMFRLAESLKGLEPENASRLMLGLKSAREELIQLQMSNTQELLRKQKLGEATTEQKQILAKLRRLQDLLLSVDLDFQMQLARLRQIREIIRRLDKAIKEEDREQKLSQKTAKEQQQAAALRKRALALEELVKRQTRHVAQGEKLAAVEKPGDEERKAVAQLSKDQQKTGNDTKSLAAEKSEAGAKSKNLNEAVSEMGKAAQLLQKQNRDAALPSQKQALEALKRELSAVNKQRKRSEAGLGKEKFASMRKDQEGNRNVTDRIAESVRQLGDSGAGAVGELIRAGGSMSSAEGQFGRQQASPASTDQGRALRSLKYARNQLQDEADRLLDALRGAVKRYVLAALSTMLEKQVLVRESTEILAPRVKRGSRQALTSVVRLGKSEERIIDVANEVLTLVEETEFGIALPAALRVVRRSMIGVRRALKKGDASKQVVTAERQVEEDLKILLDAMKEMPASRISSRQAQRGNAQDRRRELNRMIAELKMIRLLQVRVNDETIEVNGKRPTGAKSLSAAIEAAIEDVEIHQEEVLFATEQLTEERGEEIQQP